MSALRGLRVVELGGDVASAYCGKMLAGFGATVLRPQHGAIRRDGPLAPADEAAIAWLDTGKHYIAADEGAQLRALVEGADLVIDGLGPGGLEALGVNVAAEAHDAAGRILLRLSPWGMHGPMAVAPASDITLYAASGLMHSTGRGDREPLNAGFPLVQLAAGLKACCAALMALHRRSVDGRGDVIEVSMQEAGMDTYEVALVEYLHLDKLARRNGDEHNMVPWRTFRCRDGWAAVVGGPIRNWLKAAAVFDDRELLSPRLAHMADRMANRDEVYRRMQPWLARHDKRDIFHTGQRFGLAWTYLASLEEAAREPQFMARDFFIGGDGETLPRQPGAPFRPQASPWQCRPAPTEADAAAPGGGASGQWRGKGKAPAAPLAGITVIDLTHDWAGPHAARLLADYGAEVIKIEYPKRLDGMRGGYRARINAHPRVHQLHRNKRSVTLDLHDPAQREACHRLIAGADILIDNSRPGVMARKGLDPDTLRKLNPGLVAVSLSAFGATGPYADYAGYGGSIEAISGLQDLTAYDPDGERFRVREMDVLNGVFGAVAALVGLAHRDATGEGQWIDLAETETTAWLIGDRFLAHFRSGWTPQPTGNRDPRFLLQDCLRCAGEDAWIAVTVDGADAAQRLQAAIGASTADHLAEALAAWCAQRRAGDAEQALQRAGIAAAAVRSARDLAGDAHLQARNWWLSLDGKRYPGLPFHFARGGGALLRRGPDLGQDNPALLPAAGLAEAQWPDLSAEAIGTAYEP